MPHEAVLASLRRLEAWMQSEGFRGWDPHDALASPLLGRLVGDRRRTGMVVLQLFKRSPLNLRRLFGVPKAYNAKGMALMLCSALRQSWTDGDASGRERALELAAWLRDNASPGFSGACWGYPFPWPNRGFYAPAGTPTIVNTAFAGLALLEAGDDATARSACEFVLRDLNRLQPAADELCFSYTPDDRRWVYNASLLGAELLAAVHARTGEPELADAARAAARFVVRRQRADGAWRYGLDEQRDGWVDNFHTGFVLNSLRRVGASLETREFADAAQRGYGYWRRTMFLPDGAPKYYDVRTWPLDAHAAAQAVLTFLEFAEEDGAALEAARRTALWAIEQMQDRGGWFHYQIHRFHRIRTPYMRWSQAWMQRALRELVWVEAGRPLPAAEVHS